MTETLNTYEDVGDAEPAEHTLAMLDKADQLERANDPERPGWLPSKFESPEAMAQAYAALERKLGSGTQEEAQDDTQSEEVEYEDDDYSDDDPYELEMDSDRQATEVEQALDSAGLDFNAFQDEYNETGELSDEAYDALDEAGFPRSLVDSWIQGQEALAMSVQGQVFNMVGGQESYQEMVSWAADNLDSREIEAFNMNVESGDAALTQFAVQGLYARYRSEATSEPQLVQGQNSNNQGEAFNSAAELTAAMSDPRYHKDPAYRQAVANKLSRSNVF